MGPHPRQPARPPREWDRRPARGERKLEARERMRSKDVSNSDDSWRRIQDKPETEAREKEKSRVRDIRIYLYFGSFFRVCVVACY